MNEAEKIRLDTINSMKYLKNAGFPESYLKEIHHNGEETYKKFFNYWENTTKNNVSQ